MPNKHIYKLTQQFIPYLSFKVLFGIMRLLPHRINKSMLSTILSTVGYRKKVIFQNLDIAAKKYPNIRANVDIKTYYDHMANLILEILGNKKSTLELIGFQEIKDINAKDGALILLGHIHNWEFVASNIGKKAKMYGYGIYQPLSNPYFDSLMYDKRQDQYSTPLPQKKLLRMILENRASDQQSIYLLVADQSPPNKTSGTQKIFFNQPTYFTSGPEKLTDKFDFETYYLDITSPKPLHYIVELIQLDREKDIIQQYADLLEANIMKSPTHWLWSHRRWKLNQ